MTYGQDTGGVTTVRLGRQPRQRVTTLNDDFGMKKAASAVAHRITVEATLVGDTYELSIKANGQESTVLNVDPDDLGTTVERVIRAVSKAVQNGDLSKSTPNSMHLGINGPQPGSRSFRT